MKDRSHDEAMAELFKADPFYALELLVEVCADGAADELAVLMRQLSIGVASTVMPSGGTSAPGKF
ncbi:hypothetical protein [Pseudomonas asplenii]|uniref:hypothetical protein n=1 Tax=Pseudomonas asplenii TaxID=53407 RepID=UPI002360233D|nr:hypothetical protein [Pseudomonas asplenii]